MIKIDKLSFKGNNTKVNYHKQLNNGRVISGSIKIDTTDTILEPHVNAFTEVINKVCEFKEDEASLLTILEIGIKYQKDVKKISTLITRYLANTDTNLEIRVPEKFLGHEDSKLNFPHMEASNIIDRIIKECIKYIQRGTSQLSLFQDETEDTKAA